MTTNDTKLPRCFAAFNVASGEVIGALHRRHRHAEVLALLGKIDRKVGPAIDLDLMLDNYATHKQPTVRSWLVKHSRFHLHFIPTSSSWLNQVECFFAELTRRRIRCGTFTSVADLERAIEDYLIHHNRNAKPFVWTASADAIFKKIHKVYSTN